MASSKPKAPKTVYLLELIRRTTHKVTGKQIESRQYRLYETLSSARGKRTSDIKNSYNWEVTGHIYIGTVDWVPLPEYEESVHDDMFSRLDLEMEVD